MSFSASSCSRPLVERAITTLLGHVKQRPLGGHVGDIVPMLRSVLLVGFSTACALPVKGGVTDTPCENRYSPARLRPFCSRSVECRTEEALCATQDPYSDLGRLKSICMWGVQRLPCPTIHDAAFDTAVTCISGNRCDVGPVSLARPLLLAAMNRMFRLP